MISETLKNENGGANRTLLETFLVWKIHHCWTKKKKIWNDLGQIWGWNGFSFKRGHFLPSAQITDNISGSTQNDECSISSVINEELVIANCLKSHLN